MLQANAVQLLGIELVGLAALVLTLFWLRRRIGLTPLYVSLGVFQPVQVLLSASIYVEAWPGIKVSPGTLMFAASLLAVLLVYIREDAVEARKALYGIVGANLIMTLVMFMADTQVRAPGTLNFLGIPAQMFSSGARVTAVGTLVLVCDVVLLLVLYTAARDRLPASPFLRVLSTLGGVLVFDALAFTTGAFVERPDYPQLLLAAVISKALIGLFFAAALVFYLRFVEPADVPDAASNHPLRDVFYSFTYREKFELQAQDLKLRQRALEASANGVVICDARAPGLPVTYVNPAFEAITGYSPSEVVGRSCAFLYGPDAGQEGTAGLRRAFEAQAECRVLLRNYRKDGTLFWNDLHVAPVRDDSGTVTHFVGIQNDVTERMAQQQDLVHRASHDELTGLPNRVATRDALDALLARSDPPPRAAVVVVNVDRLHHVNDTLGYAAGDQVLLQVADRLRALAQAQDGHVGRIGGDEFLLFVERAAPADAAAGIADRATQVLAQPYEAAGQVVYLTSSAGASWSPEAGRTAAQLLVEADLALNLAKQAGRNQVAMYSAERSADLSGRIALGAEIREALPRDEMRLHYQPLVDANSGAIAAAEALMRWTSATFGVVGPDRFIPVAEDTGMIVPLGQWALRTAVAQVGRCRAAGIAAVPLSVNVSAVQFQRPEFLADVEDALRASGVEAAMLKLEITESVLMEDAGSAMHTLGRLRALGVRISLDDFGTGYSSLGYLRRLPIDEIKIDQGFVRDVVVDPYAATLCRAIVAMSQQLRFQVVAEGVETAEQAAFLRDAGCQLLQGYLFSRPVPEDAFHRALAAGTSWSNDGRFLPSG